MRKSRKKYNVGGLLSAFGNTAEAFAFKKDGSTDPGGAFLAGAGNGASLGSAFGPLGAAVGGIAGGIQSMAGAERNNHALKLQKRKLRLLEDAQLKARDNTYLQTYPVEGVQSSGFYARGGDLRTISPSMKLVTGDKHHQDTDGDGKTGVTLPVGNEEVEVEAGETIKDGRYVFSDQIGEGGRTYAELSRQILESPKYKQQEMRKKKAKKRLLDDYGGVYNTTAERVLTQKDALDKLFERQEASKENVTQSNYAALGLDLNEAATKIAPYVDNFANFLINRQTPEIPTPRLTSAPRLQTQVDVNDQLQAINSRGQSRDQNILQTSANAATSRANLLAGAASDISATNQVLGNKQRQEIDLQNKQQLMTYQNEVGNNRLLGAYDMNKMYRTDDIQERISQNVADASTNVQQQGRDTKLDIRDTQALALTAMKYMESGVLDRSGYSKVLKALKEGKGLDEALNLLNQAKTALKSKKVKRVPRILQRNLKDDTLLDVTTINDNVFTSGRYGNV